jgi:hypothetical protein
MSEPADPEGVPGFGRCGGVVRAATDPGSLVIWG